MVNFSSFSIGNRTARTLRAVCISTLLGVTCAALAASHTPTPAETGAASPAASVTANTTPTSVTLKAPAKMVAKPLWIELTPLQQQALAPLASDWNNLDSIRKKKWLALANKFPTMKPEEQLRMQERMREWAKLTPEQRRTARESFARTNKLNPEQKSAKWEQYQNLPEEEKKKLAADAETKKRLANLPRPAPNKHKAASQTGAAAKPLTEKPLTPPAIVPALPIDSTLPPATK